MPPRSAEEKERRRKQAEEKRQARKLVKEREQREEAAKKAALEKLQESRKNLSADIKSSDDFCYLLTMPEDAQNQIMCFLVSRDLGALSMTCRSINFGMAETRVSHLFSRLNTSADPSVLLDQVGKLCVPIKFCEDEIEVRALLTTSMEGSGETGRLVTKKSKRGKKSDAGDADEYIAYARFLEEALHGYSVQKLPGQKPVKMPPMLEGRFASVSPEHSVSRVGGGVKSGAGGSGVASWGVGKRGQLGHGKRKDENKPRMLLGGIGYGIRIVQVSAGGGLVRVAHTLLLTSTGRVLSFGTAQYGQLGHGFSSGKQLPDVLRPQYIENLAHLHCVCVSAGELHSAVVTADGDLYVWGDGFCGQLGLADKRPKLDPEQVEKGGLEDECVLSVSCGARHTLAVTEDGEVFSFGLGHFGVLGRSYTPFEYFANSALSGLGVEVDEEEVETQGVAIAPIAATHAIDDATRQQIDLLANLTLDDNSDQCIPKVIDSLQGIKIVGASAGHRHSMFLDTHGNVYTCGDGSGGALGHGDRVKQDIPMRVMYFANNGISIMQISAAVDVSMAVSTTGDVYAWGCTKNGRIGVQNEDSDFVSTPTKVEVRSPDGDIVKAVDVEAGYMHSIIVGLDGTLHMCNSVEIDEEDIKGTVEPLTEGSDIRPCQIPDYNIWHRVPEPKEEVVAKTKWKKYGTYELKGRSSVMADKEKWNN